MEVVLQDVTALREVGGGVWDEVVAGVEILGEGVDVAAGGVVEGDAHGAGKGKDEAEMQYIICRIGVRGQEVGLFAV